MCRNFFAAELNSYSVEEITAAEYKKIREQKLMRDGFIAWDEAAIRFARILTVSVAEER